MVCRTIVRVNSDEEYNLEYLVQKRLESVAENFKEIRVINIQESTEVKSYGDGKNYEKYIKVVIWYEGLDLEGPKQSLEDVHKRSMDKMIEEIWSKSADTWEDLPL